MNKKILVVSALAVLMLVTISFATAVSSNTNTTVEKKESPLFGIRTRLAIGERLESLKETIQAKFVGERIFFLPFNWLRDREDFFAREQLFWKTQGACTTELTCSCTLGPDC